MYIAIYNENVEHITNVDNATYDLTQRVYDNDTFTAEGVCDVDINDAKIAIVNDDAGNYVYACFADTVTPEYNKRSVKGLDFKSLFDTEILLDFTPEGSFDGRLSAIFRRVAAAVFDGADAAVKKIAVEVIIPDDNTDTTETYGSLQGTYQIKNAYSFLKCYLKYYEYNIETKFDVVARKIVFKFTKCAERVAVNLSDFIYELTTTSAATNKAVATIKYNVETPQTDTDGNIGGRLYPVKQKWFESEYLADAQFNAVYELANSRYVDNIIIDNNITIDPLDFAVYPLYTKVDLYYDGRLYKTLPISEKITKLDASGQSTKIKLGFKKILLTEIIKG